MEAYFREAERHDAEAQELIDHARQATRELLAEALDKLTFLGGDRAALLDQAHVDTLASREAVDRELHEALVDTRERHDSAVGALRGDAERPLPRGGAGAVNSASPEG